MKKLVVSALAAIALAAVATSCTTVNPGIVGNASIAKHGESTGLFLFRYIPLPSADISIETAAKNGGITKVATVDYKEHSILGIIVTKTTIVTGE